MEISSAHSSWSIGNKILFRFFFLFFILFIAVENNGAFPFWWIIFYYPQEWLHHFVPWVAKNVFHFSYEITVFTNGSGDTSYDWLLVLIIFIIAILGTFIWSLLDRDRENYKVLYYWLTVIIRYYVGLMLINYGLGKIIKLQFPFPDIIRLQQTYGSSSPMRLAWTFLGFSTGYNLFMGIAELAAGLLLFRRTMILGAIITLMTASNVMAVNYFYDVPVKIVSTALVLMTLFLLAHNAEEVFSFFFKDQPVKLTMIEPPSLSKRIKLTGTVVKSLLIISTLCFGAYQVMLMQKSTVQVVPPPLYGEYKVVSFVKGKDNKTQLITDSLRWRELKIESQHYASVKTIYDTLDFSINADTTKNILFMTQTNGKAIFAFGFTKPNSVHLLLKGVFKNDSLKILLRGQGSNKFLLMDRGFHWINEYPYNR